MHIYKNARVTEKPHILIVDDDAEILTLLTRFLSGHGFRVSAAANGKEMRALFDERKIALVVLDVLLPGEDGLALCRDLRTRSGVPIIMLTAMGDDTDRIIGLEVGADDYLSKPFNPRELLARIKAVLRRSAGPLAIPDQSRKILQFDGWRLDLVRRELSSPEGVMVDLSSGEYDLLLAFVEKPQQILSRERLMDVAKGRHPGVFDRSIDVQLSRLRRKLASKQKTGDMIKTVRGSGYLFTPAVERL